MQESLAEYIHNHKYQLNFTITDIEEKLEEVIKEIESMHFTCGGCDGISQTDVLEILRGRSDASR